MHTVCLHIVKNEDLQQPSAWALTLHQLEIYRQSPVIKQYLKTIAHTSPYDLVRRENLSQDLAALIAEDLTTFLTNE